MTRIRPPLWGNFVDHADWDLLSFAWLFEGGLHLPAFYHATQAVEKYLKALTLSILDPDGETETALNNRWLRTHDLAALAERCAVRFPFYGKSEISTQLRRFSEFDQAARYPWAEQKHGNGFTSADVPLLCDLVRKIRTDLPIKVDDYILGMLVRGHHHGRSEAGTNNYLLARLSGSLAALRRTFPEVDRIVRW
ncbi:MAG TPA: HEPN domain-containing protein [Candidatus Angelobacter sp.]|jgi:HEPN domain-containing protein|nr:HEPN domain-containing protein [Candidatus Angelobacter sp.]